MSFTLHVMLIILVNSLIVNELHSTQSLCGDIHVSYHTYFQNIQKYKKTRKNTLKIRVHRVLYIFSNL